MRRALLAIILCASLVSAGVAQPIPSGQPGIVISNAWARASAGAATTGVAYFTIADNMGADRLIGVSTPAADMAELHETRSENGVMRMRPVASLSLEPGKPVTLAPGGYHLMLMGLKKPLQAGNSFPLTLTFEKAPPVTVQVSVGALGAATMLRP